MAWQDGSTLAHGGKGAGNIVVKGGEREGRLDTHWVHYIEVKSNLYLIEAGSHSGY